MSKFTECEMCGKEMEPGGRCEMDFVKIPATGEWKMRQPMEWTEGDCHDCNAGPGKQHHFGCDWERCANCGLQALGCECLYDDNGLIEMARR